VFLAAGGPQRLFRRVRRAIWGPEADLPKSLLPEEVDKTLRKLGSDGEKVRGVLEREFAEYLEEKSEARKQRDLGAIAAIVAANVLKPASAQAGKRLAQSLFSPDQKGFEEALRRFRGGTAEPGGARRGPRAEPPIGRPSGRFAACSRVRSVRSLCENREGRVAEWQTRRP